jgi:hypothetical protein
VKRSEKCIVVMQQPVLCHQNLGQSLRTFHEVARKDSSMRN